MLGQRDQTPVSLTVCRELPRGAPSSLEAGSQITIWVGREATVTISCMEIGPGGGEHAKKEGYAVWKSLCTYGSWRRRQDGGSFTWAEGG